MSGEELARAAGLGGGQSYISKLENGKKQPSLETLLLIAEATESDPMGLLTEEMTSLLVRMVQQVRDDPRVMAGWDPAADLEDAAGRRVVAEAGALPIGVGKVYTYIRQMYTRACDEHLLEADFRVLDAQRRKALLRVSDGPQ